MNKQSLVSLYSIRKNILANPSENLLYFAIFGSQVRGSERPDSDLDFLYVVKNHDDPLHDAVCDAVRVKDGMNVLTRLRYTKKGIYKEMNIYGLPPYRVLRGEDTMVLYRTPDFNPRLVKKVNYEGNAKEYFDRATGNISNPKNVTKYYKAGDWCFGMHHVISDLLKTCLLFNHIRFPYTKDLHVLYEMLKPDKRPRMDVDVVQGWQDYWHEHYRKQDSWDWDEAKEAKRIARRAYKFVREMYS